MTGLESTGDTQVVCGGKWVHPGAGLRVFVFGAFRQGVGHCVWGEQELLRKVWKGGSG